MIEDVYFSRPELLWSVPLIAAAGLIYLRRGRDRLLVLSRVAVICLLAVALANPYVVATRTEEVKRPRITVLDDRTASMEIFDGSVAERLAGTIEDTQLRIFTGGSTPLGDEIVRYAPQGESMILVTDGNNNKGRSLEDALALARASNSRIYALAMDPVKKDSSVEISGTNTAVLGGDYPFTVIVRSAGGVPDGTLSVYADGTLIYDDLLQEENVSRIRISHAFTTTRTHILRAEISLSDHQKANNQYQKAVYVVPKPDVLLLSGEDSPLREVLSEIDDLTVEEALPDHIEGYKAVVLDDARYSENMDDLVGYVRDGGGLVVVGGMNAYELGGYYESALEEVLPVRSFPSTFEGGKTVVIVLDISGSMQQQKMADGTAYLDYEKALALELLRSPEFRDDLVGVVVFGTKAYVVSGPMPLSRSMTGLEEKISSLWPTGSEDTHLDDGLRLAWEMLNASSGEGELILFSDGKITDDVFASSEKIVGEIGVTTNMIQVQAFENAPSRMRPLAERTGSDYYAATYPESLTVRSGEIQVSEEEVRPAEEGEGFSVSVLNPNHYITSGLDLNATITGFNDVTPRPGSLRLVTMADGKPVMTVWRFGLGRVVALTTDDGLRWASSLYSADSSTVISSAVNWAVGDPRPEAERIDAGDAWQGTPAQITIHSNAPPKIDGEAVIEKVGDRRYRATLTQKAPGIYYLGDYGVAVNYPLELRDVGLNRELEKLVMTTGGKVYTEAEANRNLVEEVRRTSVRTVQERSSRRDTLLFTAMAIFLIEVVSRRLREVRRKRQST